MPFAQAGQRRAGGGAQAAARRSEQPADHVDRNRHLVRAGGQHHAVDRRHVGIVAADRQHDVVDPGFDARVKAAYSAAMHDGLWKGKYASVNHHEYFAEGVQSWFDEDGRPAPGRRVGDGGAGGHSWKHLAGEALYGSATESV